MPGPMPKDPAIRQRTNRVATHAMLPAEGESAVKAPPLPKHREWNKLTRVWWRDVWRSPMAAEFLQADAHGLYLLAELVDRFWEEPTTQLAAEIRLQRQCFGLTPIDRRRLQWEVERVESATRERKAAPQVAPPSPAEDPRRVLQVIQGQAV
jgi:hypothetical protein